MGCIAQVCPTPVDIRCPDPSATGCSPFITVPDCTINMKEIRCCILTGQVLCGTNNDRPVENALVFAKNKNTDMFFAGVTNSRGTYCICVPGGRYEVTCFCCDECECRDARCNCCCDAAGNCNSGSPVAEPVVDPIADPIEEPVEEPVEEPIDEENGELI